MIQFVFPIDSPRVNSALTPQNTVNSLTSRISMEYESLERTGELSLTGSTVRMTVFLLDKQDL